MSFSFGNATQQPTLGFGATPAKSTFGSTSFGFGSTPTAATTTANTSFGGFGSSFGTPASTAAPAFGSSFGTPAATSTAPTGTFGSSFGAPAQTATSAAPAFGSSFGGLATSSAPTFGSSFGAAATTSAAPPTFGGFGTFGATPTPAATASNLFSGFGAPAATTSAPTGFGGFGGFGTTTTAASGFGGFGGGFGVKTTATPTFSGFGTNLGGLTLGQQPILGLGLGQQQQQQQQQQLQSVDPNQAIYNSVFNVNVFGDERDAVLAKWNLLQASWGTGKGYYSQTQPPVEYTQQNPYCRFKAICYSVIPGHDNKEGLTTIVFNKKESDIKSQKEQLISSLSAIMGNKPNLTVSIHSIRAISESKSQVLIFVQEKGMTGTVRKIPATDLSNYLLQPMQKQQLGSLGVENVFAHVKPDSDQLKEYLVKPPIGVDIRIWKQAQLDNSNPNKYIPVPLIGFEQLKWRSKCQEKETGLHRGFLEQVSKDIVELKRRHASSVAQIAEQKRKLLELQHRVLRILVRQEVTRKAGMALQPEEEVLKGQLENMQTQISVPTQFKGRINELLAQIRILNQNGQVSVSERYTMDPGVQEDIKQFLRMEQNGISHLVEIINTDLSHLKLIRDGMQELLQRQ